MVRKDNVFLKENSQIYLASSVDKNQVDILLQKNDDDHDLTYICTIPDFTFLEELDQDYVNPRIVFGYIDDTNDFRLQSMRISVEHGHTYDNTVRPTLERAIRINHGVYLYGYPGKVPYLYTIWVQRFDLSKYNFPVKCKDVEFDFLNDFPEFKEKNTDILGVRFNLGDIDTIHAFVKIPTRPYEKFKISKCFYSEMSQCEYDLSSDQDELFISPDSFSRLFVTSEVSNRIAAEYDIKNTEQINLNKRLIKSLDNRL